MGFPVLVGLKSDSHIYHDKYINLINWPIQSGASVCHNHFVLEDPQ